MTDSRFDGPGPTPDRDRAPTPVRGPLSLTTSVSSPSITAGADFSIFVTVRNPFDVPVTLYEVQTHLPVELLDVNRAKLRNALDADGSQPDEAERPNLFRERLRARKALLDAQTGFATAVGTDFSPEATAELINASIQIHNAKDSTVAGVMFSFPENPTSEDLDSIFRRLTDYKLGAIPVQLQPGDQIVRQFRLRTRSWLFFTPLAHSFQIQARFSVDGVDHNSTVEYPVTIAAQLPAIAVGGIAGSILGTVLRMLTQPVGQGVGTAAEGILIAALATLAVVVGFARKTGSQSFVSVEDFWGGALIGFSVGFVGYNQFSDLLVAT